MRPILIALALGSLAPPTSAEDYSGAPVVAAHRVGNGGEAYASVDIHAPPARVWSVLSDCAHARRFMRNLISCRVLHHGSGWEVREHRIHGWPLHPVMRNVLRISLTPNRRLAFHRISGDWVRSEGAWTLAPINNGRGTHVSYRISAAIGGPISVPQATLTNGVRTTLADLRRVAETRATA